MTRLALLSDVERDVAAPIVNLASRYIPTRKQVEAHQAFERFILFGGAMGGGKSAWLCNEGIQLSLDYPGNRGGVFRWENKTFRNTTLHTLGEFLPSGIVARHHLSDQYFDLINGSRIYYGGLKPAGKTAPIDNIKSMELGWFAIDEASQVPEEMFLILASRLRLSIEGIRYRGLLASNPEHSWVRRRFIDQKLRDHRFVPALPKDNPHLPPDYEARLRELFPADWIKRYIDGDWDVSLEGLYVFPYMWVKAAVERDLEPEETCEIGIDIGAGGDKTVAAGRWGPVVRILHTSQFSNTMQTTGILASVLDEHKPRRTRMDVVGVGKGPYDRLIEQGYDVQPYIAGGEPTDKSRFLNRRAEDHWHLRDLLEEGDIDLPDDPVLTSQMCSIKYEIQSDKRIKIEGKEEMKAQGKPSPDTAEAVVIACSENEPARKGRVLVLGAPKRKENQITGEPESQKRRLERRTAGSRIRGRVKVV